MAYSYSAIKDFKNCPRKYYETRILKKWETPKTEQIIYGEQVHEALELYIKEGKALGPHERFQNIADTLASLDGDKYPEYEMALDGQLNPCAFLGDEVFIRGIADLIVIDGTNASIFDYKTGSAKYPDTDQLELMALMVFRHFPQVESVKAALLFILHDELITAAYHKKDAKQKWINWAAKIEQIETAKDNSVWNENPTGLCGWCVVETCPHWRPRR